MVGRAVGGPRADSGRTAGGQRAGSAGAAMGRCMIHDLGCHQTSSAASPSFAARVAGWMDSSG